MKDQKASRALNHLDDELVISALEKGDMGESAAIVKGGRSNMKNNRKIWTRVLSIAAAFIFIVFAGAIIGRLAIGSATTIALDVNPSIEIEINKNEKVKEVRALNDDAKIVLEDMELENIELNTAMNAIIGSMLKHGYLSTDQNSILLSVDTKNESFANALKEKISGEIGALLKESNIDVSVITQNFRNNRENSKIADTNKISPAKAALISKIVAAELLDANGVPYSYESLIHLRVNELKLILESRGISVEGLELSGKASDGKYISAEAALLAALEDAGFAKESVSRPESEIDFDDDRRVMVYEVEFIYGDIEYEYEIDAASGAILEKDSEPVDDDDSDDNISAPADSLSRAKILDIAYSDAGVSTDNVRHPKIELEHERGVYIYEVEFKSGNKEYEYKINALSGEIIERESEPIDD